MIKYIAPAKSELPGNNNDKRPSNLLKMEMGMLETTSDFKSGTQTTKYVASSKKRK